MDYEDEELSVPDEQTPSRSRRWSRLDRFGEAVVIAVCAFAFFGGFLSVVQAFIFMITVIYEEWGWPWSTAFVLAVVVFLVLSFGGLLTGEGHGRRNKN